MPAGGRTQRQQLGKSGCGLAFTRHQKREPARVRLRCEAQSGGWHCPHGPSGYSSTPLQSGTDGLRANRSTRKENLASGGVGLPDPTREETSAFAEEDVMSRQILSGAGGSQSRFIGLGESLIQSS